MKRYYLLTYMARNDERCPWSPYNIALDVHPLEYAHGCFGRGHRTSTFILVSWQLLEAEEYLKAVELFGAPAA